jgi:hypothetical protein
MSTGIIKVIKQAALEAVENGQPTDLRYGVVTTTAPLRIQITPQFTLPSSALVVPKRLTDHTIEVVTDGVTKTITIKNALQKDDKVALIRQKGGQSYFVLDKV